LLTNKWTNIGVIELRFYIPVDTKPVILEMFFLANRLATNENSTTKANNIRTM